MGETDTITAAREIVTKYDCTGHAGTVLTLVDSLGFDAAIFASRAYARDGVLAFPIAGGRDARHRTAAAQRVLHA